MTIALVAVIYVPTAEFDTYALRCTESCKAHGYELYGITQDWNDAVELKDNGIVDKIVVGRRDHIDPRNLPGVEVAGDHVVVEAGRRSRRRRPRIV